MDVVAVPKVVDEAPVGAPQFQFFTEIDHSAVSHSSSEVVTASCTIKAPEIEDESRDTRAPVDIVAVIDVSGSMRGEKIELVKVTLEFMLQQLKPTDRLALVTFSSGVAVPLSLRAITAEGKTQALQAIGDMKAGGGTNLSGGLLRGLDIFRTREASTHERVGSILLFTDGRATDGITQAPGMVEAVQNMLKRIDGACSIFTFGYGSDHDADMMKGIADAASGMFYFIGTPDDIPGSFGDCLGGLLSVVAQNIDLRLEAVNGTIIERIETKYPVTAVVAGARYSVTVRDLYSGESRDILIRLRVAVAPAPTEQQALVNFDVSFFDITRHDINNLRTTCHIARTEATVVQESGNLAKQKMRITAANAMSEASSAAARGDLQAARHIVASAKAAIVASPVAQDVYCQELMSDLTTTESDLKEGSNMKEGYAKMKGAEQSHWNQRSNKAGAYQNSKKMQMQFDSADWVQKKMSTPVASKAASPATPVSLAPRQSAPQRAVPPSPVAPSPVEQSPVVPSSVAPSPAAQQ